MSERMSDEEFERWGRLAAWKGIDGVALWNEARRARAAEKEALDWLERLEGPDGVSRNDWKTIEEFLKRAGRR